MVYALKRNEKGMIQLYQARLAAKGFSHKPDLTMGTSGNQWANT
jgi:hypothetical protein